MDFTLRGINSTMLRAFIPFELSHHDFYDFHSSGDFTTVFAKPPPLSLSVLCGQKASTIVDLGIAREPLRFIFFEILLIQNYALPGGSEHEYI